MAPRTFEVLACAPEKATEALSIMISIKVDGVSKTFGNTQALAGVSLEIAPGEIFFLLGPSGCGKTAPIRTLAGFCQPDHGRVYFDEVDVTNRAPHKRKTLDAKLRLTMRGEIQRLCKENGLTTVYVTHDQKEALSVAGTFACSTAAWPNWRGEDHDLPPGSCSAAMAARMRSLSS